MPNISFKNFYFRCEKTVDNVLVLEAFRTFLFLQYACFNSTLSTDENQIVVSFGMFFETSTATKLADLNVDSSFPEI